MREYPSWMPDGIDMERPAAARMYDYYLGGSRNFAADRALADESLRVWPDLPHIARANRAFVRRVVTFLTGRGIGQFLDLGSGIPAAGGVHDIARGTDPNARVVYVDSDPVAVAYGATALARVPETAVIHGDLRDPAAILGSPVLGEHLDLGRPVAILMAAVLPFVAPVDDPAGILAAYRNATVPGSYLAVSHGTNEYQPDRVRQVETIYTRASHPVTVRSRQEVLELMSGYDLVPPGLVDMIRWRPDPRETRPDPLGGDITRYSMLAAVGRRP